MHRGWLYSIVVGVGIAILISLSGVPEGFAQTRDEVLKVWGNPIARISSDSGTEILYFRIDTTTDLGDRYFVIKDGRVVDGGIWKYMPRNRPVDMRSLPFFRWSVDYYRRYPTSANDIIAKWGLPVKVVALPRGMTQVFFRVDKSVGTVCYLVKDGRVIAYGTGM